MAALEPGKARMTYPDPGVEDVTVDAMQVGHFEHAGWRYLEGDREDWPTELQETGREGMVYIRNRNTGGTAFVPELSGHLRERGWEEVDPQAERAEELEALTVEELKDEIRALNKFRGDDEQLPVSGTKAELIDRLRSEGPQQQAQTQEGAGEPSAEQEGEE